MKTYSTHFVVVLVIIVCSATLMKAQEFSYIVGSPNGPDRWGFLNTSWAACKDGTTQSPISLPSIQPQPIPNSERVNFLYNPGSATIKNRGHDIEVKWAEGVSKIRINNVDYTLTQCHWHTPSEHTISSTRYAMELHLVHQNPDPNAVNQIAVVAVLYRLGASDPFLAQFMDEIIAVSDTSNEVNAGVVNPTQAIAGRGRQYYRYKGSLTTPPCSEGVIWTVDAQIGTVSQQQIDLLRQAVEDDAAQNARPLQPRNGRPISLYSTNDRYN